MLVCPLCRLVLGDDETTCPRDRTEGATVEPVAVPASVRERFAIVEPVAPTTEVARPERALRRRENRLLRGAYRILAQSPNLTQLLVCAHMF